MAPKMFEMYIYEKLFDARTDPNLLGNWVSLFIVGTHWQRWNSGFIAMAAASSEQRTTTRVSIESSLSFVLSFYSSSLSPHVSLVAPTPGNRTTDPFSRISRLLLASPPPFPMIYLSSPPSCLPPPFFQPTHRRSCSARGSGTTMARMCCQLLGFFAFSSSFFSSSSLISVFFSFEFFL